MYISEVAQKIDHTLLKPDAQISQIRELCREALHYQFKAVCIHSIYVKFASTLLAKSDVKTCSVVGFPLGAHLSEIKKKEAELALKYGAQEIDMVINISALKNKEYKFAEKDIKSVVDVCKAKGAICKVIIETALLNKDEKIRICEIAIRAGADFIKTSTGYAKSGAKTSDIKLIRQITQNTSVKIKASGGIKSLTKMQEMLKAGASRIGTSSGIAIIREALDSESN